MHNCCKDIFKQTYLNENLASFLWFWPQEGNDDRKKSSYASQQHYSVKIMHLPKKNNFPVFGYIYHHNQPVKLSNYEMIIKTKYRYNHSSYISQILVAKSCEINNEKPCVHDGCCHQALILQNVFK